MTWFRNVRTLAGKELASFSKDRLLVGFLLFSFTFMIWSEATGVSTEVNGANVAIVDADDSHLSRRLRDALLLPHFRPAVVVDRSHVDEHMDAGRYAFVLDIPPRFEADLLRGRTPRLQLSIDATAMTQAGVGAGYIESILREETSRYLVARQSATRPPVDVVVRALFNPNLEGYWYQAVSSLIENITMFAILLVGAAVIREREHGTIEHLLVMPLEASEIAAAKILANGLVLLAVTLLALAVTLRLILGVPIRGSIPLFLVSTGAYVFAVTALGIMLATIAMTMPQFGLLAMPVFLILSMLSGSTSPLESLPDALRLLLQASPTVHYVELTHGVLFRDAGLDTVWPRLLAIMAIGTVCLSVALARFRRMLARHA